MRLTSAAGRVFHQQHGDAHAEPGARSAGQPAHYSAGRFWGPARRCRVTLIGTAAEVPAAEVRELYFSRYENAKLWQDFTDFAYYRVEITGVYFVGGFGVWSGSPPRTMKAPAPIPWCVPPRESSST